MNAASERLGAVYAAPVLSTAQHNHHSRNNHSSHPPPPAETSAETAAAHGGDAASALAVSDMRPPTATAAAASPWKRAGQGNCAAVDTINMNGTQLPPPRVPLPSRLPALAASADAHNNNDKIIDTQQGQQQQLMQKKPIKAKNSVLDLPPPPLKIYDSRSMKTYDLGELLGTGGFARCYRVIDEDKRHFAAKVIAKSALQTKKLRDKLRYEVHIHSKMAHPQIVQYELSFVDDQNVYIILEICEQKSLLQLVRKRSRLNDHEARFYMAELLLALDYLHSNNVIHRDLKLANLFLSSSMHLKVGDFGLATELLSENERKKTICGTPNYIAPEVFNQKEGHSFEVDIWALGVIMYTMLIGQPPFQTGNIKEIYQRIKSSKYEFPQNIDVHINAKTLINSILQTRPETRPTIFEIMRKPYFLQHPMPQIIPPECFDRPTLLSETNPLMPPSLHDSANDSGSSGRRPFYLLGIYASARETGEGMNFSEATAPIDADDAANCALQNKNTIESAANLQNGTSRFIGARTDGISNDRAKYADNNFHENENQNQKQQQNLQIQRQQNSDAAKIKAFSSVSASQGRANIASSNNVDDDGVYSANARNYQEIPPSLAHTTSKTSHSPAKFVETRFDLASVGQNHVHSSLEKDPTAHLNAQRSSTLPSSYSSKSNALHQEHSHSCSPQKSVGNTLPNYLQTKPQSQQNFARISVGSPLPSPGDIVDENLIPRLNSQNEYGLSQQKQQPAHGNLDHSSPSPGNIRKRSKNVAFTPMLPDPALTKYNRSEVPPPMRTNAAPEDLDKFGLINEANVASNKPSSAYLDSRHLGAAKGPAAAGAGFSNAEKQASLSSAKPPAYTAPAKPLYHSSELANSQTEKSRTLERKTGAESHPAAPAVKLSSSRNVMERMLCNLELALPYLSRKGAGEGAEEQASKGGAGADSLKSPPPPDPLYDVQKLCVALDSLVDYSPPRVFIARCIDYTDKYGLGYELTNGVFGVYFNDLTCLLMAPNKVNVEYLSQRTFLLPSDNDEAQENTKPGSVQLSSKQKSPKKGNNVISPGTNASDTRVQAMTRTAFEIKEPPKELSKKITLLLHFSNYMDRMMVRPNYMFSDTERVQDLQFLTKFCICGDNMILFRLSTDIIQINFRDHTKIILSHSGLLVTFVDKNREIYDYKLAHLVQARHAYQDVVPRLLMAIKALSEVVNRRAQQSREKQQQQHS